MSEHEWGPPSSRLPFKLRRRDALPGANWYRKAGLLARLFGCGYDQGSGSLKAEATPRSDTRLGRLEAVLFISREPVGARKLAQFACLADGTEARTLIGQLNQVYDSCGSAFRVEEIAGGYRLLTRKQLGAYLRRVYPQVPDARLSTPALETLAVVAYRQPIARSEIEAIRGVQCGEILRQLMDRDFVRIVGRSSDLGRPFIYGTTKRFLEVFGLRSLDDLPGTAETR